MICRISAVDEHHGRASGRDQHIEPFTVLEVCNGHLNIAIGFGNERVEHDVAEY